MVSVFACCMLHVAVLPERVAERLTGPSVCVWYATDPEMGGSDAGADAPGTLQRRDMSTAEGLRAEVERLSRELEQVVDERLQSARYGLVLLEEKEQLRQEVARLDALNDNARHELRLAQEVRRPKVRNMQARVPCVNRDSFRRWPSSRAARRSRPRAASSRKMRSSTSRPPWRRRSTSRYSSWRTRTSRYSSTSQSLFRRPCANTYHGAYLPFRIFSNFI